MAKRRRSTRRRRTYSSSGGGGGVSPLILFLLVLLVVVWLVSGNRKSDSPDGGGAFFGDWLGDVFPGWEAPTWNFYDPGSMFYHDLNTFGTPGSAGPNEYGNSGYAFGYTPSFGF